MKKFLLPLIVVCAISFTNCDYVKFPNDVQIPIATSSGDTSVQRVLLEEFTGQGCGNCPGGTATALALEEFFGDRLILLTVHSGWFANGGNPWAPNDMNCNEGEELNASLGILNYPEGMVNRREENGNPLHGPNAWSGLIQTILDEEPSVDIDIDASYNSNGEIISADINIDYLVNLTGEYKIVVAIAENNIIAPQENYPLHGDPNYDMDTEFEYPHQHVLRGHMNSTWGTDLVTVSAEAGTSDNVSFTKTKGASWNAAELDIVVYIYDVSSNEIIQVEKVHLN